MAQEGGADRTPPVVTWLAPEDGAAVDGTVTLRVEAADASGIGAVRFLVDGRILHEATRAPFAAEWDTTTAANMRHALQARVIDRAGNGVTSPPVTVKVANFNLPPVLAPIGAQTLEVGQTLSLAVSAADPDGARDPLSYQVTGLPDWAAFDPKTGTLGGVPELGEVPAGESRRVYPDVTVTVCDPQPLCDAETFSITVAAPPRQATAIAALTNQVIQEGEPLALALVPPGLETGSLTCQAKHLPPWGALDQTACTFSGTPGFEVANNTAPTTLYKGVAFEVCGPKPPCAKQVISIAVGNVNHPPAWEPVKRVQLREGQRWSLTLKAADPDKDPLKLEVAPLPAGAVFTDHRDGRGTLAWTPGPDQAGAYQMAWGVGDGAVAVAQTLHVDVANTNLAIAGRLTAPRQQALPAGVTVKVHRGPELIREVGVEANGRYVVGGLEPGAYVVQPELAQAQAEFSLEASEIRTKPEAIPSKQRVIVEDRDQLGVDFVINPGSR